MKFRDGFVSNSSSSSFIMKMDNKDHVYIEGGHGGAVIAICGYGVHVTCGSLEGILDMDDDTDLFQRNAEKYNLLVEIDRENREAAILRCITDINDFETINAYMEQVKNDIQQFIGVKPDKLAFLVAGTMSSD